MDKYSFLNINNIKFIENLYNKYLNSPNSIDISWSYFFKGFDFAYKKYKKTKYIETNIKNNKNEVKLKNKELEVISLIYFYYYSGHLFANNNPINKSKLDININDFNLNESDLNILFNSGKMISDKVLTLSEIIYRLKSIYCESIGIEYMYINEKNIIFWIQNWINNNNNKPNLSNYEKKKIFFQINKAIEFENFLHTKFIGVKRFSIEGNESLIPALYELINYSSNKYSSEEFIIGMAHRGRLNVLSNIIEKSNIEIFNEFYGKEYKDNFFSGDVKYHLGATLIKKTKKNKSIKVSVLPNPSHLESVGSILQGISRAIIDNTYNKDSKKLIPILIHGDASISAQGIIYEIIQLSQLNGYKTGGTIHIIINNQIGFTTNSSDGRSSFYCTDIAKTISSPVLHVNSDDVEAVIHSIRFAVDFRINFKKDIFIDLLGYRKYGHNEGDDPYFTQPLFYKSIINHPNLKEIYKKKLEKENIIDNKYALRIKNIIKNNLENNYKYSKNLKNNKINSFLLNQSKKLNQNEIKNFFIEPKTNFPLEEIIKIGIEINTLPKEEKFYKKIEKLFNKRLQILKEGKFIDWGTTELLTYGTLLKEGFNIRLSGEDVERGTFSHRHSVIFSEKTEKKYITLNNIKNKKGKIEIYNSLLSEYAVMGFDYGYSISSFNTLTLWEAQFGDFSNGAQIIIDQYLSSAEDKWKIQNGLVLLLPHGYEGQGSEHSSSRIERYLQLSGRNNMFIVNCSFPSNFYHCLRRHMKLSFRKPLIIFTPKSLLRNSKCTSSLKELSFGSFKTVVDDKLSISENINKLIICSGKIYYDLIKEKEEQKINNSAIIRIEQLYPFPEIEIEKIINKYKFCKKWIWVQEEPENMGAWSYIYYKMNKFKNISLDIISRNESAAPASGSYENFIKTQEEILKQTFKL